MSLLNVGISRRECVRTLAAATAGLSSSWWAPRIAAAGEGNANRKRSCILLWMAGGPSTIDLWDLKPGHAHGGPFREIMTQAPGLRWSEHLPRLAGLANDLAVVRSMRTREGDHGRATVVLRTGYSPQPPIQFPLMGSLLAKELAPADSTHVPFVSIGSGFAAEEGAGGGFLGPLYAPLRIGASNPYETGTESLRVADLEHPPGISDGTVERRRSLLAEMEERFSDRVAATRGRTPHPNAAVVEARQTAYERAMGLMHSPVARAFDLEKEPIALRRQYGDSAFGRSCLLARRLVASGVSMVEVNLGRSIRTPNGWDTHQNNFDQVRNLSDMLDAGFAALLTDLKVRGMLETTTIVWMGEFGRTPRINSNTGRDHFPAAWSMVLAGGGIQGGQAYGATSADGSAVTRDPVSHADYLATLCLALGIDPQKQNLSNVGRPIRVVDGTARPIRSLVNA
ncbi:MAG: DUF1501 domain-containing protein [Gemmataceae bacterium]|nr:DUF1501 domain-containing protein [Gemmataceae bacterium]